jgi:hypothetical protein
MRTSILIKSLFITASLPLLAGCIVERSDRTMAAAQPAPADAVVVEQAENPPTVRAEVMPAPPGPLDLWVWVPGCWEWRGQWVWVAGRWAPRPHPHAVWVMGHWTRHNHGYIWVSGHWR